MAVICAGYHLTAFQLQASFSRPGSSEVDSDVSPLVEYDVKWSLERVEGALQEEENFFWFQCCPSAHCAPSQQSPMVSNGDIWWSALLQFHDKTTVTCGCGKTTNTSELNIWGYIPSEGIQAAKVLISLPSL